MSAPDDDDDLITCDTHGETPATFVCRHVAFGVACGFHANPPAEDDPWPDAWCDLCEAAFQAAGGEWNEESESGVDLTLLCTHCYEAARARNIDVPQLARGASVALSEDEASKLFHHAVHAAQAIQEQSQAKWNWHTMARWDYSVESLTLTMSDPDRPTLVADLRLVGSYSTNTNTFQWAWETCGDCAPEAAASARLRELGTVRGISKLATPNFACDEDEGWKMASLAAYVLGADSLYRAPSKHLQIFMLLDNWRVVS
ncbi:MAG: hypothetical protein HOV81_36990 [Kofleriaceae bacterium]|nr:hypothetical protein [Kofleriaceae bacterium]